MINTTEKGTTSWGTVLQTHNAVESSETSSSIHHLPRSPKCFVVNIKISPLTIYVKSKI